MNSGTTKEEMAKRIGALIGRFQGYHYHHHEHVRKAALENDILVVIIGSANARRSIKNPFTAEERIAMIEANVKADPELNSARIVYRMAFDHPDDKVWASRVQFLVQDFCASGTRGNEITLYGSDKDDSTFYLNLFPMWKKALAPATGEFNATKFRSVWFDQSQTIDLLNTLEDVPTPTAYWLEDNWSFNEDLQLEWNAVQKEKERFAGYPFPECLNFCCGDAVIFCHDHVLMGVRKNAPGRNCLALPGGHKNSNETFYDCSVREADEETNILKSISYSQLARCEIGRKVFDNPKRSLGVAPRLTQAVYFDVSRLYPDGSFPATIAGDDLKETMWVHRSEIEFHRNIYDDHSAIIITAPTLC